MSPFSPAIELSSLAFTIHYSRRLSTRGGLPIDAVCLSLPTHRSECAGKMPDPMKTLAIEYPEDLELALDVTEDGFAAEARVLLAYKLFELGRLTSGQAARFAGVPRVRFLLESGRYGVPAVLWDGEELAAEAVPLR